uniref:diacylglycerol/lipid kinase family protein n=1 Tax=Altererythrobacter segetis TaxID=1104773 RepID=UPI00140D3649|nr:diacylglycerol kinase family protein [Altererythrobacter segetis]
MNHPIKTFDSLPQALPVPLRSIGRAEPRAVPLVGVIRNPRSFRNKGLAPEQAARAEVITETALKRTDLLEVLARFASAGIDYLAIDGGDGTVRDVLTWGASAFGDDWPPLIVLPKGKTNALAADLGLTPQWELGHALELARKDSFARRRTLVVAEAEDPQARVQGFMLGAGVFTRSISLGQSAHRWGAFNSLAVFVTTFWTLAQAFLAGSGNAWRRPTGIRVTDERGDPIAGDDPQRYILLSSTLENFPMGLKPFGAMRKGLKLAILDRPWRKSLLRVPQIAFGRQPKDPARFGYHWLAPDSYLMTLDDRFILDGEAFPPGAYRVSLGPELRFVVP